jgi:endonuclease-3
LVAGKQAAAATRPARGAKGLAAHPKPPAGTQPPDIVEKIFDALAAAIVPTCELDFASTFELLVAVVLSAHTTDRAVNAATAQLFPVANTPAGLLALGEAGLAPYLRPVGLHNSKARHVIGLCRALIESHGGQVPGERAALEALPGVGRKTANVVLNIAFGQPTIAVDTHVQRVAARLGLARAKTPAQTEQALLACVPERHLLNAHHYLILHGRHCCKARRPECWRCPVREWCPFAEKTPAP